MNGPLPGRLAGDGIAGARVYDARVAATLARSRHFDARDGLTVVEPGQ